MKLFIAWISLLTFFLSANAEVFTEGGGIIQNNGQETNFNLSVSGLSESSLDENFGIQSVCIDIQHPAVEELNIYLQSPDGIIVQLSSGTSCFGTNYTSTCFDNNVTESVTLQAAPYTGTYRPIGYLGRFNNGQTGIGIWKLIIKDYNAFANSGDLISWTLSFGKPGLPAVTLSSSNLPIVIIDTDKQIISNKEIIVKMGIIDNGQSRNYINNAWNNFNGNIKIHLRGSSTLNDEKKSFTVEICDASGKEQNVSLLGMPPESDWALVAYYKDKSLLRIPLSYHLFGQMGHYSPRLKNVEVVLNNEYIGLYALVEKPKRDPNRVNISKLTKDDNAFPDISGGYILKIDRADEPGWFSLFSGAATNNHFYYQYIYPNDSNITEPQKAYIKNAMDSFETIFNSPDFTDPQKGYLKYINIESFIDFFILNELSKNVDGYRLSTYLYKEKYTQGGKIHMGPVWDYDLAWHNCNYGNSFDPNGWKFQLTDSTHPTPVWWGNFMQDPNFVNRLYCRWLDLRQNVLSNSSIYAYIDSTVVEINEARLRNFIQWPILGTYIFPNPQDQSTMDYEAEVNDLKNWIASRLGWMDWAIQGNCSVGIYALGRPSTDNLFIYPNPMESSTTFLINSEENTDASLTLTNSLGKDIYRTNIAVSKGETKILFNRQGISSGIYFYQLKIGNDLTTGKIIIQ